MYFQFDYALECLSREDPSLRITQVFRCFQASKLPVYGVLMFKSFTEPITTINCEIGEVDLKFESARDNHEGQMS